ncbi:MAG: PQQ-dependent sugar dehydrogenase [Tepidisphaeraceae bacterium]
MSRVRSSAAALAAVFVLLPAARGTAPAVELPKPQCAPDNGGITLPTGFCAVIVAEKLGQPRHIVVMPNGDLFVSSNRGGVIALRDTTGDGRADVVQDWATGYRNSEVRYWGGHLYTETGTAILRYPLKEGSLTASGAPDTIVSGLPAGGHGAKTFVIGADGALYVNIGSRTNSCQQPDRTPEVAGTDPCVERESRAGVWAFRADRAGQKPTDGVHFGIGIRNAVAMTINPSDKSLFVMQHGRDGLAQQWSKMFDEAKSAETPAEEMFRVTRGDDFGWPYCYFDRQLGSKILAPEYGGDGKTAGRCASLRTNVAAFPGHWAPNGLVFYSGTMFPAQYRGGAFVAFHGSWNRAPLPQAGYNVVFQPMDRTKAAGSYEVFADGFRPPMPAAGALGAVSHRPTGLAVGPDGSLYVADDQGGTIYRIMYTGR